MKWILLIFFVGNLVFSSSLFQSNIEKTFLRAQKENKPLLIDFFGIWCPPCNELDELVFESTDFIHLAKSFLLLKVDADSPQSWKLKDQYKVGSYPTILFLNPKGEEIYRVVGFLEKNQFIRAMKLALSSNGKPVQQSCNSQDTDDLWRCAVISSERGEKEKLKKSLMLLEKKIPIGSARFDQLKTLQVENYDTDDLKRNGYQELLTQFSSSPLAFNWAISYAEFFEGGKLTLDNQIIEKVLSNYTQILKDPKREELGIPETDLIQMKAELLNKIGKTNESKKTWLEAAQLLKEFSKKVPKNFFARGYALERISALENAAQIEEALQISKEYQNKFPEEFTFHYTTANLLEGQKKYPEAVSSGQKAFQYSYGDNKIRVATLMVRLYSALSDKESAQKLVQAIKEEFKPSPSLSVRTHRYLTKLDEAYYKLLAIPSR